MLASIRGLSAPLESVVIWSTSSGATGSGATMPIGTSLGVGSWSAPMYDAAKITCNTSAAIAAPIANQENPQSPDCAGFTDVWLSGSDAAILTSGCHPDCRNYDCFSFTSLRQTKTVRDTAHGFFDWVRDDQVEGVP